MEFNVGNSYDPYQLDWRESIFILCRSIVQFQGQLLLQIDQELTRNEFGVLRALYFTPGIDQNTIVRQSALDKATVTATVQKLEQRGLITRDIAPHDRRVRVLNLTLKGYREFQHTAGPMKEAIKPILEALPEKKYREFIELFTELVNNARKQIEETGLDPEG